MSQTLHHEAIATEIAAALPPTIVRAVDRLRQGDVIARLIGPPAEGPHAPTPANGGILLAAGNHGEHRLIGRAYRDAGLGKFSLTEDAVLVHTDTPNGRHGPICLPAGTWEFARSCELDSSMVVVQQRD